MSEPPTTPPTPPGAADARYAPVPPLVNDAGQPLTPTGEDEYRLRRFLPVGIETLAPGESPDWIWPGYVARGHSTLFTGLWKAGKTTILAHILRELTRGGDLVPDPLPGFRTLIVSEEGRGAWSNRRDELELENIDVLCRPLMNARDPRDWESLIQDVAQHVRETGTGLVVFDTLSGQWPVQDENAAPLVRLALDPLTQIIETRAGLMLIAHPRKSGGTFGTETRGSSALPGWVDCTVTFSRYDDQSIEDRRRKLHAVGRMEGIPPEMVYALDMPAGARPRYRRIGAAAVAGREESARLLLAAMDALGARDPAAAKTKKEIVSAWNLTSEAGTTTVGKAIQGGLLSKTLIQIGRGTKADPHRYYVGNVFAAGGMVAPTAADDGPDEIDLF